MAPPSISEMFSDATGDVDRVEKFDLYKAELNKALGAPSPFGMPPEQRRIQKAIENAHITRTRNGGAPADFQLNKAMSGELIDSISRELGGGGFLGKDLDLAGPGSTGGLHAYDLLAPSLKLVPRQTPLRNRIARTRGMGTAHEFKRITGYSNARVGGVPNVYPGITETGTTGPWGGLDLIRGPRISYAGDRVSVPFCSFSISDTVSWDAQFSGQGYEDLRQFSSTSALWSAFLAEEQMLLGNRGTASGFSGAVGTPGTVTVTSPAAATGQTAVSGAGANVYVSITATTLWGETALSAVGNSAVSAGDVVVASWGQVPGATGYNVFIGTGSSAPATSATWLVATTAGNSVTIQGALPTSGRAASTVNAADTPTAYDVGYDGILSYVLDPDRSGYLNYLNGPLTSDAPFQDAFAQMYQNNAASPETILANGSDRRTLSDLLTSSNSSSYRIVIESTDAGNNGTVGALVSAVQNGVTGDMVELLVHRFMPRGVMPLITWNLPVPDSNVANAWAVVNVQDVMGVAWPQIQFTYDFSVYWRGTFCSYAPAWSGAIAGITA